MADEKKNIKFGIAAPVPGASVNALLDFTVKCEESSFDSVWYPDHILYMAKKLTPEAWSVITAAAVKTKSIHIGAIGDPHRFHPAIFAHRLATVDHLSEGRIFSCLGYGEKMNLDYYGIEWDRPLLRLRESISIMRKLWKGEIMDFEGQFYNLKSAEIRINPIKNDEVPIYIAATAPKSLSIAGELGNGWVTNAMPTWVYSDKADLVNKSLAETQQNSDRFERAIYIFISIARDENDAYNTLDNVKHAIIWPDVIEEAGYDINISDEYKSLSYTKIMPNDSEMLTKFREMGQKYYTREILSDFIIYGNANSIVKRLEQYIDSGVNHFILRDFSPDLDYSYEVLTKKVLPVFKS